MQPRGRCSVSKAINAKDQARDRYSNGRSRNRNDHPRAFIDRLGCLYPRSAEAGLRRGVSTEILDSLHDRRPDFKQTDHQGREWSNFLLGPEQGQERWSRRIFATGHDVCTAMVFAYLAKGVHTQPVLWSLEQHQAKAVPSDRGKATGDPSNGNSQDSRSSSTGQSGEVQAELPMLQR